MTRDLFTIIFLTTCATLFFVWWVKEVLIPTWDEKALKKEESKRAGLENSLLAPGDMPKSGKEIIRVNDSDIYPDWGEGPESTDEIK